MPLLVRFIDDIYGILKLGDDDGMSADELEQFESDLDDFGILTWDMEQPTNSVDFLDLTVTIDNGKVSTRTFRKERNLYQYLSPLSNHPRGIIKGMIHGMLKQYFRQNSNREDYWKNAMLLHRYLRKRGCVCHHRIIVFRYPRLSYYEVQNHSLHNSLDTGFRNTRGTDFVFHDFMACIL